MIINWPDIDSVFLDLDGTLLDLHFDNHFWLEHVPVRYAEKHGLDHAEARCILNDKYTSVMGSLNWYCVEYWSRELQLDIPGLKLEVSDRIAIRPQVEEFLQYLHMHGKRVVLVTNAHPASIAIKMDKTGLDQHFNRIVTAHELGKAKEEAAFWPKLQKTETFRPQHTLFIDDNFSVLDAARDYGLKYLLAIKKPDSKGQSKHHHHYRLLDSFDEIID
ncbi:MAG: GMP/IMP nucleotidase [Gammaproteobacteria bacterium]|nr:MAG: GMP/IMP nucleotidase [Gammaproteobacteria bacterium]